MRTNDIEIKLTIPFYYNTPDGNGVTYTKEAIINALNNIKQSLPIVYRGDNVTYDEICIGYTNGDKPIIEEEPENNRFLLTVSGVIDWGGTKEDGLWYEDTKTMTEFTINTIGLSEGDKNDR